MSNFLRNQKGNTKGIAQFTASAALTGVAAGTVLAMFATALHSSAAGVTVGSATTVVLTPGKRYKLSAAIYAADFSSTTEGYGTFSFYNDTVGAAFGPLSISYPSTYSSNVRGSQPHIETIITPAVVTTISIRCITALGTFAIGNTVSYVTIEELEEFIPQSAGDTLITGDLQVTGGIKLPGTAQTAGMLGEIINTTNPLAATTLTTSETDITNASLTLTPGQWRIEYSVTANYTTGAAAGANGLVRTAITDSANTRVGNSARAMNAFTPTTAAVTNLGCLSASIIVTITSTTTYKLRGIRIDNSSTGIGVIDVSGATPKNYEGSFYAQRIA